MSFIDKVKYINQLAIVDEFGGRGTADKTSRFYIVLRVTDENGSAIQITVDEVKEAIQKEKPNIVITDYLVITNTPWKCCPVIRVTVTFSWSVISTETTSTLSGLMCKNSGPVPAYA